MDIFEQILGDIDGGQVLDIATSRGGFVKQLRDQLKSYDAITGVDIDAEVLETAQNNLSGESVQFMLMDVGRLGFVNGRFDTVSASAALHHLPDVAQVLGEIKRVLKPGGTFIFVEMHCEVQTEAQRTIMQIHHWAADVDTARGVYHNKTYTRQELIDFIEGMALQELAIYDYSEIDSDPMDAGSIANSEKAIDTVLQRAVGLPEYESLKVRSEALRKRLHDGGAQWEPILFITGQKPLA